jgi:hypothetical protein
MVTKGQWRTITGLALLVMATIVVRQLLTGGLSTVRLKSAPPLAGVVAQSLGPTAQDKHLPVAGKDFQLENVRYFDDRTWAVASVISPGGKTDPALIVLKQFGATYQVVLGPGTAFSSDYLQSMPLDVGQYLTANGVFYGSGG